MALGGTDRCNDTFSDTGDDRFFTGAADETVDVGADGDFRLGAEFDTVHGDRCDDRRFNDFRVDAHLNGLQNVTSGKIDGAGFFEIQGDVGSAGRDQRIDDAVDVTARHIVRFQFVDGKAETCFGRLDQRVDDTGRGNFPEPHADDRSDADRNTGSAG